MQHTIDEDEVLARTIHIITHWSKNHQNFRLASKQGLVKLPPVFTSVNDPVYGSGYKNLVCMIKALNECEQDESKSNTLSVIASKYNSLGGLPTLNDSDIRKIHNWIQKVSFATRAAVLEQESNKIDPSPVSERVYKKLYASDSSTFITVSPENSYELKPLKKAPKELVIGWIKQEEIQRINGATFDNYGAQPTREEWETYGLKGQLRTLRSAVSSDINDILKEAKVADYVWQRFEIADELDNNLRKIAEEIGADCE